MNYQLVKDVLDLVEAFENDASCHSNNSIEDFKKWIVINNSYEESSDRMHWDGKDNGRSPESVISTLLVHMSRYAKSYSKSAMIGSDFSTQEDFIYLINLKAFGAMSKMDLIKKNVHEKPAGSKIIDRLIQQGWVDQVTSETDKRSKLISITDKGLHVLEKQMDKIRTATNIVTGDLNQAEKMQLIYLLNKLEVFHQSIYDQNYSSENLLTEALKSKKV